MFPKMVCRNSARPQSKNISWTAGLRSCNFFYGQNTPCRHSPSTKSDHRTWKLFCNTSYQNPGLKWKWCMNAKFLGQQDVYRPKLSLRLKIHDQKIWGTGELRAARFTVFHVRTGPFNTDEGDALHTLHLMFKNYFSQDRFITI